jgi:hypothetical protein
MISGLKLLKCDVVVAFDVAFAFAVAVAVTALFFDHERLQI